MMTRRKTVEEKLEEARRKKEKSIKEYEDLENKFKAQKRTERNTRLYQAAGRLEQIVHEGGFPDWEFSYPKTSGKTYRDLDDTVTILGEVALRMLREGRELKKETPWQKKQRKEQEGQNEY